MIEKIINSKKIKFISWYKKANKDVVTDFKSISWEPGPYFKWEFNEEKQKDGSLLNIECMDCGEEFVLGTSPLKHFIDGNLDLEFKCDKCATKNKPKVDKKNFNYSIQSNFTKEDWDIISSIKVEEVALDEKKMKDDMFVTKKYSGDSFTFRQIYNILNNDVDDIKLVFEGEDEPYLIIENGVVIKDDREWPEVIIDYKYMHAFKIVYPEQVDKMIDMLIVFIRKFYGFPFMTSKETLEEVVEKIRKSETDKGFNSNTRAGNDFLKSKFKSYYMATRGMTKKSMYDAYHDDAVLTRIIKNRLGITYKEHWDISQRLLRRGFISNYFAVSFFNPVNVYKMLNMIAKPTDTILDMSSGFGARMLGWHTFQDGGKYIGYEPNTKTYKELVDLSKDLGTNIEMINLPFEEAGKHKVDVCFSCPPYFDTEKYCDEETQSLANFDTWELWLGWLNSCITFQKSLTDNVYMVVDAKIKDALDCSVVTAITNKGSHFSNKIDNLEYLIKL